MCLRSRLISLAIVAASLQPALAAQDQGSHRTPKKGDDVVVKGCLVGPSLQATETVTTDEIGRLATPLTYQLKGEKKLLKQMRDAHDGRLVEVIGTLKSTLPQDSAVRGKTIGRTKVTFGIGTPPAQAGAPEVSSSLPVLEVKSYDGSATRCAR